LVGKSDFKNLEALILAALIYWALTGIFTYFQGRLEKKLSKGYVRTSASTSAAIAKATAGQGGSTPSLPVAPGPGTDPEDTS
jgi:hypothetical protein